MNRWSKLGSAVCGAVSLLGGSLLATSAPTDLPTKLHTIDSLMHQSQTTLRIPGMSVGIVVDGQVVFTKGYGVRNHAHQAPVTEHTLFAIGSCSKAFTTFALGQLVDEGNISWDDPVIKHIPEFRLHDLHATHHLTIRDLMTHRSGLPRHDFAWYNAKFPRQEILRLLQHLEPTCDLREKFQYNNLMYAVAGLVIERTSGQTWEDFVHARIFTPLGMTRSNCSVQQSQQAEDFASPHTEKHEQIEVIPFRDLTNVGPAGSINSSVAEMAKWVQVQLSQGVCPQGRLIQAATLKDMHVVHMPIPSQALEGVFGFGYGLGWLTGLHKGHYVVGHSGGIDGFISYVLLLPDEKIGVVVLTNSDSHFLFPHSAALGIADLLLDKDPGDWLCKVADKEKHLKAPREKATEESVVAGTLKRPIEQYVGEFEHPGYGLITISPEQEELVASYHDIPYLFKHKCYDHFTLSSKLRETHTFDGSFLCNSLGEIVEFHLALESSLPPIVFQRKASTEFSASEYLQQFVGTFDCPLVSMEISLRNGKLVATVPGQRSCDMKPEKRNLFSLKDVPNCSLEFVPQPDGDISELLLHQAGQTFTLQAKSEG